MEVAVITIAQTTTSGWSAIGQLDVDAVERIVGEPPAQQCIRNKEVDFDA
jgi:hypothetical protein